MKRVFTILLAVMLMMSLAFTGCQKDDEASDGSVTTTTVEAEDTETEADSEQEEETTTEVAKINYDKKYDINIFQWGPRDIEEGDEIIKHLCEKFNIEIKVDRILAKEYVKNLEIKVAAGDLPDFFRNNKGSQHVYRNMYEDDYLASFTEYSEKYDLQGIREYLKKPVMKRFAEKDGFFRVPTDRGFAGSGLVVRKDWMDQLNLDMPKTMEEYKNLLKAFKDNNMGGEDTVPVTGFRSPTELVSCYTGCQEWKKFNGKWTSEYVLPEYKEALRFIQGLYSEGLIDQEIFTLNESQANGKFIGGKAGVMFTMAKNRYVKLKKQLAEKNPDAEMSMIVPMPEGPAGIGYREQTGLGSSVIVPKIDQSEDKLTRIMALVDYMHTEEGLDILINGIEGIHYNMEDGKMVKTDAYERDIISGIGHLTAMLTDYSGNYKSLEGPVKENYEAAVKYAVINPAEGFTSEVYEEYDALVEPVIGEWSTSFITGEKDLDEDWDEYLKQLEKAGLDKLTEEVAAYLNEKGIE